MGDVAFGAGVVRLVLLAHQDDEVQVVPDVVLQLDVLLEGHRLVVELVALQTCDRTQNRSQTFRPAVGASRSRRRGPTADETRGLQDLLLLLLLAAKVSKRVDDDAEDQVQDDDDDDEVEQEVVHHAGRKQRLLRTRTHVKYCVTMWTIRFFNGK